MRVVSIDPAPAKPSTLFDGDQYSSMSAPELRNHLDLLARDGSDVLVCWDAPLTGPTDSTSAGSRRYDFTKRSIERFFSLRETGYATPKGISVLGYGDCPHWTISRSLLGLPRVGRFDSPESKLPFQLLTQPARLDTNRPSVVEIHPAVAAWLWCRGRRGELASWQYKGKASGPSRIRMEMWEIIRERVELAEDLPCPHSDDQFDAVVGYILGVMLMRGKVDANGGCMILGNARDGAFLLPYEMALANSWICWRADTEAGCI